jgi:coenzyme F420-reducing hydrogenase gamma subunit
MEAQQRTETVTEYTQKVTPVQANRTVWNCVPYQETVTVTKCVPQNVQKVVPAGGGCGGCGGCEVACCSGHHKRGLFGR